MWRGHPPSEHQRCKELRRRSARTCYLRKTQPVKTYINILEMKPADRNRKKDDRPGTKPLCSKQNRIVLRRNSCLNSWHYLPDNVASQNLALFQGLEDTQRSFTPPIDRAEADLPSLYTHNVKLIVSSPNYLNILPF